MNDPCDPGRHYSPSRCLSREAHKGMMEGTGMLRDDEVTITTYYSDRVILRLDRDDDMAFVSLRTNRGPAWLQLADIQAVINVLEKMKEDMLRHETA